MIVSESAVLHARNQKLSNSDDWPIFTLYDACVTSTVTGKPISLLSAGANHPVKVTGRLNEIDDAFAHCIKHGNYKRATIEIAPVRDYSFAEFDDGSYGFWAAGQAGWHEIERTVPKYKAIMEEMAIATSMLYFIADKTRRSRKTDFTKSEFDRHIARQFKEYYEMGKYPLRFADADDVREGFNDNREFLIGSMFEGQEGVKWQEAPMMKYFVKTFPDDVLRIKSQIFGNATLPKGVRYKGEESTSNPSALSTGEKVKRKRGRPPKNPQAIPLHMASRHVDGPASDFSDDTETTVPRKRKSILQPSGSRSAKKAKKGTERRRSRFADDPENDAFDEDDLERTAQSEISPISTIKNGQQLLALSRRKEERRGSDSPPPPDFLPKKFLELKVVDYDVYSLEPQGPGDLWTCPFEDCHVRVHKASTSQGKESVHDHFETHKGAAEDRITLAINESRPYLPINNLVRKLQGVAPAAGEEDIEHPGRKFVAPIRCKY